MPPHHLITSLTHREACWLCELNVENVQAVCLTLYPRQQHTSGLPDLHHASVDIDLVANLIELPDARDVWLLAEG
jgi:hypothetical protein